MVRVGLIGCGYISGQHIDTMARHQEFTLKAVSDLNDKKMHTAVQNYMNQTDTDEHIAKYKHYEHLLLDPTIDVVVISVISGLHADIAKKSLIAQKHIILEKPMALSLQDIDDMMALAKRFDKKIFVCHQLRYLPLMQMVHDLIKVGALGQLYFGVSSLRLNRSPTYYQSASWKGSWDQDGGMLINQGIHLIDLLLWCFGDVTSVYGDISTYVQTKETEDIATGVLTFKNGAKGLIEANTITQPENMGYYLSLFGEKGSLCIGGKRFNQIKHCYLEGYPYIEKKLKALSQDTDAHLLMYDDFLKGLTTEHKPLMTGKEGKRALEVIFGIYESTRSNTLIKLPMSKFATREMSLLDKGEKFDD